MRRPTSPANARRLVIALLAVALGSGCFSWLDHPGMCVSRTVNNCTARKTIATCDVGDGCAWGPRCVPTACMNCDEARCDPGDGGPTGKRCWLNSGACSDDGEATCTKAKGCVWDVGCGGTFDSSHCMRFAEDACHASSVCFWDENPGH